MRKLALAIVLTGVLALAACGGDTGSNSNGSTITMGLGSFTGTTSITVKAGDSVTFDDSNGGTHQLVIGTNGQFTAATGAPSELNSDSGVMFNSGDKKAITFANAGTFSITCKIHPSMQATVTVTQ